MCSVRSNVLILVAFYLVISIGNPVEAATKKIKKPAGIAAVVGEFYEIAVKIKVGKRKVSRKVTCMAGRTGLVSTKAGATIFTELKDLISYNSKLYKKYRKLSYQNKANELKAMNKSATKQCVEPVFSSLDPIKKEEFDEDKARLLFERFAFGGSEEQIQRAVVMGLDATVDEMFAFASEPINEDRWCDGYLAGEDGDRPCENMLDYSNYGARADVMTKMLTSPYAAKWRLFLTLHDRLAASPRKLEYCEKDFLREYYRMLEQAATSGDFVQLARDSYSDPLYMLNWLNGKYNQYDPITGRYGNEDGPREFLELDTIGPSYVVTNGSRIKGAPVYDTLDIREISRAATGWLVDYIEIGEADDKIGLCIPVYSSALHDPNPKILFHDTPWQTVIQDMEGALIAVTNHPALAENLADYFIKEYVGLNFTDPMIIEAADKLRKDNYKLIPFLKMLAKARATYAEENRDSLFKHPIEYAVGFSRMLGLPVSMYYIDDHTNRMGQRIFEPPTVFGWTRATDYNLKTLNGEGRGIEHRNFILQAVDYSPQYWNDEFNFDFFGRFLSNLPKDSTASLVVIDKIAKALNVKLTAEQRVELDTFMNFYRNYKGELVRDQFDPFPDPTSNAYYDAVKKTEAIMAMIAHTAQFQVK